MITPGVWRVAGGKVFVNTPWGWNEVAICGGNVEGSPTDNARLIAAAPDMLAALRGIIEYSVLSEDLSPELFVIESARLAVARAEGLLCGGSIA